MTIFLHNLSPSRLWSTSISEAEHQHNTLQRACSLQLTLSLKAADFALQLLLFCRYYYHLWLSFSALTP